MGKTRPEIEPPHEPSSIGVVYPTCGRPEMLVRSISALLENDRLPDEIVVVDQSRETATREALARLADRRIVHVPSAERGLSRARNLGIRASRSPVIGFLDDDCIPAQDWVSSAERCIRQFPESAVWIGCLVRSEAALREPLPRGLPVETLSLRGINDPWKVGPTGGNCLFRRSVFDTVGLFDPLLGQGSDFPGAEDGDMIYRTLRSDLQVTFSRAVRCLHLEWRSEVQNVRNGYNYGLGVGAMLAKFALEGDYFPLTAVFGRRFMSKFLALPYHLALVRLQRFQVDLAWSRGIVHGFVGWWKRHAPASS